MSAHPCPPRPVVRPQPARWRQALAGSLLLLLASAGPGPAAADAPTPPPPPASHPAPPAPPRAVAPLAVQAIAPGHYLHRGPHAAVDGPGRADIANLGFVVGERCVAVIDSGGSLATGQALRAAVRQHTDRPICHVIATHVHYDHLLGHAAFLPDRPTFIGHAGLAAAVAASRAHFLRHFGELLGPQPETAIVAPDRGVAVDTVLSLDLGGRRLLLQAHPRAHTPTDLTVLDPEAGVLWAGDLVMTERLPVLDGSLRGWLALLERLPRQQPGLRLIVPGHGPVAAGWDDPALAAQRRYLQALLDGTRRAVAAGRSLTQWLDEAPPPELGWQQAEPQHAANLSRALTELEWE